MTATATSATTITPITTANPPRLVIRLVDVGGDGDDGVVDVDADVVAVAVAGLLSESCRSGASAPVPSNKKYPFNLEFTEGGERLDGCNWCGVGCRVCNGLRGDGDFHWEDTGHMVRYVASSSQRINCTKDTRVACCWSRNRCHSHELDGIAASLFFTSPDTLINSVEACCPCLESVAKRDSRWS